MKARRSIYGSAISSVVLLCAIYLATPATAQGMWGFLKRHIAHLLGTACLMLCLSATALGQTSTITYQGRLTDAGSPPTGTYDIQFKLYDALTAGSLQGSPNTVTNATVNVTSGIFTVQLDFGPCALPGATRFLEISVRHPG